MNRMLAWTGVCIALACISAVVSQEEIDYRIPRNFRPEHYDVEIRADFYSPLQPSEFFLDGWVTAYLRCVTPTNLIHLHFRSMTINQASVVVTEGENPAISIVAMSIDSVREFFIIEMSRDCRVDELITVSMNYTGPIRNDGVGLYYSQYNDTGAVKYMASTQFETTDARKAFPCMDEPSFKTTFQASLWHKDPLVALFNTPNVTTEDAGLNGWKITRFERTNVVMATYLVAFVIADYEYLDDQTDTNFGGETLTRQWARHDAVQDGQLDYSHEISTSMLEYLELHFNHSYAPVKCDQVSVPAFVSGAMENWGLIMYRETRHLVDPDYCGGYEIDRLTYTVAHENVHMWLGNVVTCEWWSELWIQEGHANFYEHRTTASVQPTWDTQQSFVARVLFAALRADDNGNEHPLYVPVGSPAESDMVFSTITYDKGASVIRMVEQLFLGYDTYQRAIVSYINEKQYQTATHEDLVRAWDRQAAIDGLNLPINVTEAALTWIRQTGFPVIKLTVRGGTTVEITQKMLLEWPDRPLKEYYPSPYGYTWFVPVSYTTNLAPETMNITWLQRNNRTITLPSSIGTTGWILGNFHAYGFYRVNYDDNTWNNLISQLNVNHLRFNVSNRALLIHDANAFGKCGELHHVIGLQTTEYLFREDQWAPWYAMDQSFSYVNLMLSETVSFGKYKKYLQNLVNPIYTSLGWDDIPGEPIETVHLRALAIDVACKHEHVDCLNNAWTKFSAWRNDPSNLKIIRPDVRRAVVCAALSRSLIDSWDFVFAQYQLPWQGPDAVDRPRLRSALACSTDRSILNSYFAMAATGDSRIYPSDRTSIMTAVAGTHIGNEVAWDYLSNNWNSIYTSGRLAALETVVQRFSTAADKYALEQFFVRYPAQNDDEQARYDQMIRNVDANIRWQSVNYAEVAAYLDRVAPADAKSILSVKHTVAATKQDVPKALYNEKDADLI